MKFKKRMAILGLSFSLVLSPFQSFAASNPIQAENIIITFKDKVDLKLVREIKKLNGHIKRQPENLNSISATVPSVIISKLKAHKSVKAVEKDAIVKIQAQTADWGIEKTSTNASWDLNYTGKGVKVAVLDTGISNHEDLIVSGGVSFAGYTSSYADDNGHGTHVAGIIGAKNNTVGSVGVANDAQIYAVKVMGQNGSGLSSSIISGIDWAISNQMDIINLSLGFQSDSVAVKDAIDRAVNSGIIVVAAAGNDGNATGTGDTVDFPARYENVIAVAATDSTNKKASFSSAGPAVDVSAPGVAIYSTLRTGDYGNMQGTSMAAPYVAGIAALYKEAYPDYSASQIRFLIENNALDLGTQGKDNLYGLGLVQAPKTPGSGGIPAIPETPSNLAASDITTKSVTLSWDAVSNATVYDLKRNGVLIYTGKTPKFVDSALLANTSYTYSLSSKNVGGTSAATSITVKTKPIVLSNVTGFKYTSTDTSINLLWSRVSNATSYVVKKDGSILYDGPNNFFNHTSLTPGTLNKYEIIAVNANGMSNPVIFQAYTKPSAPTNLSETHTPTTALLSWDAVSGATYYLIKDANRGTVLYKGVATSLNISKLLSGVTYSFTVFAGNVGGTSEPRTITLTTTPTAPATPKLLVAKATQSNIALSWSSIYNAQTYEVKRNGVVIYEGNLTTFNDQTVSPGQSYSYAITAKNSIGSSASLLVNKSTIPATPTNLSGTPSTTSVSLQWDPASGSNTYYIVKRNGTIVYKGPNTSFVNSGLLSGVSYQYTVTAGNISGMSPASGATTVQTIPTAPVTPKITKKVVGKTSVSLYWASIYNAKTYEVKRDGVTVYTGTALTFTDNGLNPGQTYTYSITATNDVGSSPTITSTLKTIPNPPEAVTNVTAVTASTNIAVKWDADPNATYYIVQLNGRNVYKGPNASYKALSLKPNTSYSFKIFAGNTGGISSATSTSFTTTS